MYIVGGSIPEVVPSHDNDNKKYNTCLVINPSGKVVGKHRKVHLFDVDVPGGLCIRESDTVAAGGTGEGNAAVQRVDLCPAGRCCSAVSCENRLHVSVV